MVRDRPYFGVGLNNWGVVINPPYRYGEHRDLDDDSKDGIVETIYLLVAAECGLRQSSRWVITRIGLALV